MAIRRGKYIMGIDEVGRGALAGPVVVAAVCFPSKIRIRSEKLGALRDSKKLSPKAREQWAGYFKTIKGISSSVARVYPRKIEKINITGAANHAASMASERLVKSLGLKKGQYRIFLDGGLFIKNQENLPAKTIIKGDEKITAVKVASIVAKVQRDKYMKKLSKKHPQYGFEIHKGYGTKLHRDAINRHGPSEVHRLTFLGK